MKCSDMNYLIIGDDEYIRDDRTAKIRERFLSPDEVELNYSAHDPENIDAIMDSLGTMPFIAEKRVVLVREAQRVAERSMETILSYLEKPSATSVLVLSSDGSFKKNKFYRKLSSKVKVVDANTPDKAAIRKFISSFLKEKGIEITREAADLILELKGEDLAGIKTELEKLAGYSGGGKIEAVHVEELVGRSVSETVFKLVDAINSRDADWAFRILNDLYGQKKQAPEIIGYLGWYLRMMQKIALVSSRGGGTSAIAAETGYSPAYVKRLLGQSKKYPVKRIDRWVWLLFEADREIKTGLKEPELALETLLVRFLNG